jgi:hypothetical protein
MSVLSTIRSLAESIFHRRDVEREMDEELLSHGPTCPHAMRGAWILWWR